MRARYRRLGLAGLLAAGALVAVGSSSTARPAAAAVACRAAVRDVAAGYLEATPNVYADSPGPGNVGLCQITAGTWALRARSGWCAIVGDLAAAWLSCVAGGPGPHELARARCTGGDVELVYDYGETGHVWANWLATAGPRYGWLMSTSPSRPDRLYVPGVCN